MAAAATIPAAPLHVAGETPMDVSPVMHLLFVAIASVTAASGVDLTVDRGRGAPTTAAPC